MVAVFYAHSANKSGHKQSMYDHLARVSNDAATFANGFAEEEGRLAGLLHDIGKYGDLFVKRLEGKEHGLDHWSAGAWIAALKYRSIAAALAIQGHHIGLQVLDKESLRELDPVRLTQAENHPLGLRLTEPNMDILLERLEADGLAPVQPSVPLCKGITITASAMLDIRMLFSCLVDADFLDTEAHFDERRIPGQSLQAELALSILTSHIEALNRESKASNAVKAIRNDLWQACCQTGLGDQGLWTLSAPTGAGKTLAMLGFALQHAIKHNLQRIVVVIPYLSIIDQTARTYRDLFESHFGPEYVIEHHSMKYTDTAPQQKGADYDAETEARQRERLLTENWDAPIIITTSVQMLESLFSNRPSACRKLHNLSRSVILFDEVQTLPLRLVIPTLQTLSRLATPHYKASVVFSTATQPAFNHLDKDIREEGNYGWQPQEVVLPNLNLFARAKRTKVVWSDLNSPVPWTKVAKNIASGKQTLCIVNLKRHARDLMKMLLENNINHVWHLSTNMCPAHRKQVLSTIKRRLKMGLPCRLVSTQCVEAGVDIDFPKVYRAFSSLDSVAQAAGRCNRSGNAVIGEVIVFLPEEEAYPDKAYGQAAHITKAMLRQRGSEGMDIDDPALFEAYYQLLYSIADLKTMKPELQDAIKRQHFVEVAKEYRIIDEDTINVLVPYPAALEKYESLADEVRESGLTSKWIRKAQPYTISLFRPKERDIVWDYLEKVSITHKMKSEQWFIYWEERHYHLQLGLLPPEPSGFYHD